MKSGMSRREATLEACRLRLRPILMTSFAFILGVAPLCWSRKGPEWKCDRRLGVALFSGMLGVTIFGIFLTPVFFTVIDWLGTTPAFHSAVMRRINHVFFGIFAFGYLRRWLRHTGRRPTAAPVAAPEGRPEEEEVIVLEGVIQRDQKSPILAELVNGKHSESNGNGDGDGDEKTTPLRPIPRTATQPGRSPDPAAKRRRDILQAKSLRP